MSQLAAAEYGTANLPPWDPMLDLTGGSQQGRCCGAVVRLKESALWAAAEAGWGVPDQVPGPVAPENKILPSPRQNTTTRPGFRTAVLANILGTTAGEMRPLYR